MSLPRQVLAQLLDDALPAGVNVMAYARDVGKLARDTVMLRLDSVKPADIDGRRDYSFTALVITHRTDDKGPADDALDALLEDVLHAVETDDTLRDIGWSTATRAVFLDANPCYEITLTIPFTKGA